MPAPNAVLGEATLGAIESHRRDVTQSADAAHSLERRWRARGDGAGHGRRDGIRLSPRSRAQAPLDRLSGAEGILDPSCYDLLASEARLASFMAIAKGEVARALVPARARRHGADRTRRALVSWSGSMFEYLMPSLVMRAPAAACSNRRAVSSSAGRSLMVPRSVCLGISESAYNVRDLELTYQYSNFGVRVWV